MKVSYFLFLFLFYQSTFSQKKILNTQPTSENISIDGKADEASWLKNNQTATDFIMHEPDNGKPIPEAFKTTVKILHDNTALYILAELNDPEPALIQKEITNRDVFGASDHFSIQINGFNDGQQEYRFYVSAAGVQMDCLATEDNEDYSWDAIWESKARITDKGWLVEMRIPYAALRFSNKNKQTWGINFSREIKRKFQKYAWNPIDTKLETVLTQAGLLEGIENIKPPTRLFLIPYTSAYYRQDQLDSDRTIKAGLDIKYGINDSFTLDAILIPDFGQTKFDNAILNLEPFEQTLTENRPFFTEGTDLFTKGNLFYSRRIGGTPIVSTDSVQEKLATNETIASYPTAVNLTNALKISGRTQGGLGIGFMNAVTQQTFATIENTETHQTRKEEIQPLTNYNLVVFDQRFRKNSSVSFINASTVRNGNYKDANASALVFDLNNKANAYNLYGSIKNTWVMDEANTNGINTELGFAKTSGKYRYDFSTKYVSKDYNANDLGINFYHNYHNFFSKGSYRITNPTKHLNTFKITEFLNIDRDNTTNKIQSAYALTEIRLTTLKNHFFESYFEFSPLKTFDFYQPQTTGRYNYLPEYFYMSLNYTSNTNKPFSVAVQPYILSHNEKERYSYGLYFNPKYRINNQFSISYIGDYTYKNNDRGLADFDNDAIIYSERNRVIFQNDFSSKYALTNKMTLNLTARYYWAYSDIHQFFTLENDGELSTNNSYNANKNRNFNSWNFDLAYSWWFAPGSELSVLYRNYAQESSNIVEQNISTNLKNVFDSNLTTIFSVRLRYFVDYNSWFKG